MALILNIETSSDNCSVALAENGIVSASSESKETKSHATVLTVMIEDLLLKNSVTIKQLDAIAVSKGPGSYTGLRIGVSVAKGLCYGVGKPLIGINTLQSMMNGLRNGITDFDSIFPDDAIFCPMLDARRLEVYMALFSRSGQEIRETRAEIIEESSFSEILAAKKIVFFGSGAEKCKGLIKHNNALFIANFILKAEFLTVLAEEAFNIRKFEDVAYFEPFYLKDFLATIPKRKIF